MRTIIAVMWAVVAVGFAAGPMAQTVYGQGTVPTIEDAELVFNQGLDAFQSGDYEMSYRRFRVIYEAYELNQKTTAALLMAAKSLYRSGRYDEAMDLVATLEDEYASSSYLDDANRLRQLVEARREREANEREPRELAVALPLTDQDATLTQALFTGVRIAVDEHNAAHPDRSVRMVFRDTGADPERAASLVESVAVDADAVIGPLYSPVATAAAEAAQRAGVVLLAPLANSEDVSAGRRHVFQANPTFTMRGRLMARFAMRGLLLDNFGIVAERDRDQISERMAEGFQEEALLNGEQLQYYVLLESQNDWGRLNDILGADTLTQARAVFMPMAGGESIARIDAALASFDRMGLSNQIRVLGNTEWHETPNASRASRYATTYSNDFYVDEEAAAVLAFQQRFEEIVGERPDPGTTLGRLAFTGYDVARFLLPLIIAGPSEELADRIHDNDAYQGLGIRIDFGEGNVNEALYYFRYQDGRLRLLR